MLSLECPNGLCWNDKDRHHYPNMILITGVIRGYARSLRPIDAERLLNLMISLSTSSLAPSPPPSSSSFSSMFRPNDVSYATVIDAYSRIHDGPNAERVLEMMKYRNDDNKVVVDDDEDDDTRRINHANIVAYNATISAWARSARKRTPPTLGDVASSSSSRLHDAPSSTEISYSRLAAESAERLLREMWTEHEHCRSVIMTNSGNNNNRRRRRSNTLLPDVITYSTVISAYAACLDQPFGVTAARKLLTEMEDLVARELDDDEVSHGGGGVGGGGGRHPHGFQPNTLTYNALYRLTQMRGMPPPPKAYWNR